MLKAKLLVGVEGTAMMSLRICDGLIPLYTDGARGSSVISLYTHGAKGSSVISLYTDGVGGSSVISLYADGAEELSADSAMVA
jgi:hypothetical protein